MKFEVWDKTEEYDLIIYKFTLGFNDYLAEVSISDKRLMLLRDYNRYMSDLPDDKILVGELEYNTALRELKNANLVG